MQRKSHVKFDFVNSIVSSSIFKNSIVLIRNIGNETKREPLKFARVKSIHKSRDNAQRVVTLTYNNIKMNKNGDWIGTPVTVDRSVNDLVLVDNALSDSMLGPRVKRDESQETKDVNDDGNGNDDDVLGTEDDSINDNNENAEEDTESEIINNNENDVQNESVKDNDGKNEPSKGVRRSARNKVQRMTIEADDIGDCDTENDPDYEE